LIFVLFYLDMGIGRSAERVVYVRQRFASILRVVEAVRVLLSHLLSAKFVRENLRIFRALELLRVLRVVTTTV
jgi:hypothetical protein